MGRGGGGLWIALLLLALLMIGIQLEPTWGCNFYNF